MNRDYNRWTEEEDARLIQMRDVQRMMFKDIDKVLGRPHKSSNGRYHVLARNRGEEPPKVYKSSPTLMRDAVRGHESARVAAGHTTITGMLLGDPPPGHSALDQKMGTYIR